MKKIMILTLVLAFMAAPAFAGNRPEFDAVKDDSANFFNDSVKALVVAHNPWNVNSDFGPVDDVFPGESFTVNGNDNPPFSNDLCFPYVYGIFDDGPYQSVLTTPRRHVVYEWTIVVQMQPESDIDLNIRDCVYKHNSYSVFGMYPEEGAEQTGRYLLPGWVPFFVPAANPSVKVQAHPGPNADPDFVGPFYLDARKMPGLDIVALTGQRYTSKAIWEEGIVMVMPETGVVNSLMEDMYTLAPGDYLVVTIDIPYINPVDIRYGADNVVLKYIGVTGTELEAPSI